MSKTLKWIYQLGYKHAENKLYHQLHKAIDMPKESELVNVETKSDYEQKRLRQREEIAMCMHDLIESVFHPTEYMTVEQIEKNRFEL